MKLSTHLGRDRFAWMQPRLTRRDHAVLLVRVAGEAPADAPPRPERARASRTFGNLFKLNFGLRFNFKSHLSQFQRRRLQVVVMRFPFDTVGLGLVSWPDILRSLHRLGGLRCLRC